MRHQHEIPGLLGVYRGEFLSHALGESRMPAHENRHIGAQGKAQRGQAIFVPAQLPEVIQAQQGGRRIGAASTDAAAHGQDFLDPDVDPQRARGLFLKLLGRPHDQVAVVGDAGELRMQANDAVIAHGEGDFIAVIEKLKDRLQFVIAVFPATEDVQHQIEFCRGGQGQSWCVHAYCPSLRGCHSLITSVTSRSRPCSLIRSGSQ